MRKFKIFILFSLVALTTQSVVAQEIPRKFFGVWEVAAAVENGVEQTLPADPNEGAGNGEFNMPEIILYGNRMVQVKCSGEGMVCKTEVLGALRGEKDRPLVKIACQLTGYMGQRDNEIIHALITLDGDQLKIAFSEPKTNATKINDQVGGNQLVLTLRRRQSND